MKTFIVYGNIVLSILTLAADFFYARSNDPSMKAAASACFALMGLINLFYAVKRHSEDKRFCVSMFAALLLCMFADIVLVYHFIIGAALFALGHISYFIAHGFWLPMKGRDLLFGLAFFVATGSFLLFSPLLQFGDNVMLIVCLVYALIISMMVGKVLSNMTRKYCMFSLVVFLGSLLFMFSDLMWVYERFGNGGDFAGYACLITYYPAQCILAYTIFMAAEKGRFFRSMRQQEDKA